MKDYKKESGFPNQFTILTGKKFLSSAIDNLLGSITFFLTPVGMTVFWGETFTRHIKDPVKRASRAISTMYGLTNASYISDTLITLIAILLYLSLTAIGPAISLF